MLKISSIFLFSFVVIITNAQITFEKTFGGSSVDIGFSVEHTNDGGYIAAGSTTSFSSGAYDVYIIKINEFGDTAWTKVIGGPSFDEAFEIEQTNDNGYILACYLGSYSTTSGRMCLVKINENGELLWVKGFSDGTPSSVQQTFDGGYVLAGNRRANFDTNPNIYIVKTDSEGDSLWTKTIYSPDFDISTSVRQTSEGGYIVTGYSTTGPGYKAYLIKLDSEGTITWKKRESNAMYTSVWQTNDKGYIITGSKENFSNKDVYLLKTDSIGNIQWERTYGASVLTELGESVQQTDDGGYIVAGTISLPVKKYDIYLFKTNSIGEIIWARSFGGNLSDHGFSVDQTNDNGYIVCGYISLTTENYDVYIIKTNDFGEVTDISNTKSEKKTYLYPNPTEGILYIDFMESTGVSIELLNSAGSIIYEETYPDNITTLNIKAYVPGIYYVRITTSENTEVHKIIKK